MIILICGRVILKSMELSRSLASYIILLMVDLFVMNIIKNLDPLLLKKTVDIIMFM